MTDITKKLLKLLLRISVTVVLLLVVFSRIDFKEFSGLISSANWLFLIAVWLLTLLVFWLFSFKMRLILKRQDCDVPVLKIFSASAVAMLYSLVMPGILSSGVKWYILKHHTNKGSNVLSSMVYNQTTEIAVTAFLGLLALVLTNPIGGWKLPVICSLIILTIIITCVLLLNRRTAPGLSQILQYFIKHLPKKLRTHAEKILDQIMTFQAAGWQFHLQITVVTVVAVLLGAGTYIFAAKAAGINVPAVTLVWQSAVVYLLGRLPISVGNLGVREFTLVEFLAVYGVDAPTALLMSMIVFSCTLLMAIIGLIYQLSGTISDKKHSPA